MKRKTLIPDNCPRCKKPVRVLLVIEKSILKVETVRCCKCNFIIIGREYVYKIEKEDKLK